MRVLVIDTCAEEGSFVLGEGGVVRQAVRLPGRSASERLLPMLRESMHAVAWQPRDLRAIAVVNGPGSFTGIRIGLSAAKGLSEAAGAPLLAISRLHVLCALGGETSGPVHAFLDAGRSELFYGCWHGSLRRAELLLSYHEAVAAVGSDRAVVCQDSIAAALASVQPMYVEPPGAVEALPLVARRVRENDFDDPATLDGNYLRQTEREVLDRLAMRASAGGGG